MSDKETGITPADGPIYQAITARTEPVRAANLADLVAKTVFVHQENGKLRTYTRTVRTETVAQVIALLDEGEIG